MPITQDIADFAASFSLRAAPPELLPRVREAFLDSFGVMLAGSREESAQTPRAGFAVREPQCGARERGRGAHARL